MFGLFKSKKAVPKGSLTPDEAIVTARMFITANFTPLLMSLKSVRKSDPDLLDKWDRYCLVGIATLMGMYTMGRHRDQSLTQRFLSQIMESLEKRNNGTSADLEAAVDFVMENSEFVEEITDGTVGPLEANIGIWVLKEITGHFDGTIVELNDVRQTAFMIAKTAIDILNSVNLSDV